MAYSTITIKRTGDKVRKTLVANAAITPGMLIEVMSTGKVRAHATGGGTAMAMFAVEDDLQGNGITDAYSASNDVQCEYFRTGDEVYALLANGENASIGSFLESNGDGYLRVVDTDASLGDVVPGAVVAQALEAVDLSGTSGADPATYRIKIAIK